MEGRLARAQESLKVDLAKAQESRKVYLAKAQSASELRQEKILKSFKADQDNRDADFKAFLKQERAIIMIQLFITVFAATGIAISTFFWSGGDIVSPWRNHSKYIT